MKSVTESSKTVFQSVLDDVKIEVHFIERNEHYILSLLIEQTCVFDKNNVQNLTLVAFRDNTINDVIRLIFYC